MKITAFPFCCIQTCTGRLCDLLGIEPSTASTTDTCMTEMGKGGYSDFFLAFFFKFLVVARRSKVPCFGIGDMYTVACS